MHFDVSDVELSELSSIGDSFTNLIYSLAVWQAFGKPVGKRASNYVLSQALLHSGLREGAGPRLDKGGMADYAEAIIFYAWAQGKISLDEGVSILTKNLKDSKDFRNASIAAFTELLKVIKGRLHMD